LSGEIQVATHEATPAIPDGPALSAETLEKVMVEGDLSKLSARQRIEWYRARCEAAGLDPRAQPFQYLSLQGKLVLYATKACSEQLTGIHKLSVALTGRSHDRDAGIYTVDARATFPSGRSSDDTGVVSVAGLKGEALSNAIMKATTKAKRRAVLSACGLAMPDESEVDSIDGARRIAAETVHANDALPAPAPPRNNSGHGRGQYASPEKIASYKQALEGFIARSNAEWADLWSSRCNGEVPKGIKEVNVWQADGHLLKWAVETGRLDGGIVPEEAKTRQLAAYVAIVYHRSKSDQKALGEELRRYLDEQHSRQAEAVYRERPELDPDAPGEAEADDDRPADEFEDEPGSKG
jgi:hypothetical protein